MYKRQEDMEANGIRREIWEARYKDDGTNVADGYLKFWMSMEFQIAVCHICSVILDVYKRQL